MKILPAAFGSLFLRVKNQKLRKKEESRIVKQRKVQRRRYKAHTYFPAIDHRGDFIMSERRNRPTRRVFDVFVDDVDLPTMFLGVNKQM